MPCLPVEPAQENISPRARLVSLWLHRKIAGRDLFPADF